MNLSITTILVQVIAAILSVVFYKKYKSTFYKLLCAFLVVVAFTEIGGFYVLKYKISSNIIHYISVWMQLVLLSLIYILLLKNKIISKLIIISIMIFTIMWFFGFFDNKDYFLIFAKYMCFKASILSFLYLRKLLISEEILNFKKHLPFWVSVGFLVFYLPAIPFFTVQKFMVDRGLFFLLYVLIIFMNLIISYGLICSNKEAKY